MKKIFIVVALLTGFVCSDTYSEQINVQIIYDCSGSMGSSIKNGDSKYVVKSEAAKDALNKILIMISDFHKINQYSEINVGIVSFPSRRNGAIILPLQKFDRVKMLEAITNLPDARGSTPLGQALQTAYGGLPRSGRSHIFVLTDGEETGHIKMSSVIRENKNVASLYFVAFDVNAKVFYHVKNLGAFVVQADNADELNKSVQTIFNQNILLEKED